MALTYQFTKSGFTTKITVFKDSSEIYVQTSATAGKDGLLDEARVALADNYPESATMAEINPTPAVPVTQPATTTAAVPVIPVIPPANPSPIPKTKKPAGKGIEAVVTSISNKIADLNAGIDDIYYGNKLKKAKGGGIKIPGTTEKINGLLPIVTEIVNVDFCNILAMAVSKAAATKLDKVIKDDSLVGRKLNKLKDLSGKAASALDSGKVTEELLKIANKKLQPKPEGSEKLPPLPLTSKASYNSNGRVDTVVTEYGTGRVTYKDDGSIRVEAIGIKLFPPGSIDKVNNTQIITIIVNAQTEYINQQNNLKPKTTTLGQVASPASGSTSQTPATDEFVKSLNELSSTIDTDAVTIVPQLANSKNYLDDIRGSISQYTDLNTIPNADIQRVLGKIRGVKSTLDSISSINSIENVLDLASRASGININNQIQGLQKKINIAQIIPAIRYLSNLLKAVNKITLKLLSYVKILQTIGTVLQVLLKVLGILVKVLKAIPIPLMFVTSSVTQTLSSALQRIEKFLEATTKRVTQIISIVELVYNFIIGVSAKISELISLLDILILNLRSCEIISDPKTGTDPRLLEDLLAVKQDLVTTQSKLDGYTAEYAKAKADNTGKQRTYNGYILKIVEEEVVDGGIKYKRRRGIATDSKGVLVAETQVTFATNLEVIYEELKLLLKSTPPKLDTGPVVDVPGLPPEQSDDEVYESIGLANEEELNQTSVDINAEISNFIGSIKKGGKKFQKTTRKNLAKFATDNAQQIKLDAKDGKVPTKQTAFR
jgi:hypothetical protein